MEFIQAKIYFYGNQDDIRRIHLPRDITFDGLVQILKGQQAWVDVSDPSIELKYMDQEADWIIFKSQEEWQIALDTARELGYVIRIEVIKKKAPTSEKVISFVKGIDFRGLWGAVMDNVSSIKPLVTTFTNGLCQPQQIEHEHEVQRTTIVDKQDLIVPTVKFSEIESDMSLTEVFADDFRNLTASDYFYSDMSDSAFLTSSTVEKVQAPEPIKEDFEDEPVEEEAYERSYSSSTDSEEEDEEEDEEEKQEEEELSEDEDEEQEVTELINPQYEKALGQILEMGFHESERPKMIQYLAEYDGDVIRVVQRLLEN
jgi:hypothetical protein